jgi:LCP family protein required for cell wall assembly
VARLDLTRDRVASWTAYLRGRPRRRPDPDEPELKSAWWLKAAVICGAILMVISGGTLALLYGLSARYNGKVDREDILAGVPAPAGDGKRALNFLVLGSDSREGKEVEAIDETGSRSDTIMIVHINKDVTGAFIVSIPRDSYVDVPAGGNWSGGKNKINSAFAFGGANLAAKTVYNLTHVPFDGAMIINFAGIRNMVAAVGGIRVCTPFEVKSYFSPKVWGVGCHDMSPADAEEFARQRYYVPGGDFGRIKNQQNVIKGLMAKAKTSGVLTNPGKLDALLTTAAESLTVDKNLNLRDLAFLLKGIDPKNVTFATAPTLRTMKTDAGSSVELDMPGTEALFQAVLDDKTDEWLAAHPQAEIAHF